MCKRLVVLSVAVGLSLIASTVLAQCGCGSAQTTYAPVEPSYTTYYAPTVAYYPPESHVTFYNTTAAPQATYYAPVAQPYAAYYAPVAPQPYVARYGTAGWSMYGTPKVYMPYEPVRNVLRAITP